ncbi:helix-turn-helix domain-containing protein [Deinococcus sp.]|uniref:helix-turn-helix domain-containing protein n=1 Tax=Deinococcus sp. TaxID=47478 RepID=UPI0025CDF83D|nr:helix-turn-helix domain-containing protein [Deinococcus sp.]
MSHITPKHNSFTLGLFVHSDVDDAELDIYEFRVYAHLCRRVGDSGRVWEGQARIAEVCKISRRKAQEALYGLRDKGWLTLETRFRDDGSQTTNDIVLVGPPASVMRTPLAPGAHPPSTRCAAKGNPIEGNPIEVKDLAAEKTPPPRTADSVLSAAVPKSANRKKTGEAVAEGEGQGGKATGSGAARPRNLIFDAIVTALYPQGAGSNASQIGKVTAKLSGAGWAAADVVRVIEWRVRDPWWARRLTLGAFEKHCEDWKRDSGVVRRSLAPVAEPYEDPSEAMFK